MSRFSEITSKRLHSCVHSGGALFHWVSGLVIADMSMETFQRAGAIQFQHDSKVSAQQQQDQQASECLSHEMFHAIQVSLCGYPLRIACLLSDVVLKVVQDSSNQDFETVVSKHAEFIKKLIEPIGETVDGISVAAIMEAGALLAQKRFHKASLTASEFRRYLNSRVRSGSVYRIAYDYAEEILSRTCHLNAFDHYPLFANPALCAKNPADAFIRLLEVAGKVEGKDLETQLCSVNRVMERLDIKSYGDCHELLQRERLWHPLLIDTTNRLGWFGSFNRRALLELYLMPHQLTIGAAKIITPLIALRPKTGSLVVTWVDFNKEYYNWRENERRSQVEFLQDFTSVGTALIELVSPNLINGLQSSIGLDDPRVAD